MDQKTCKKLFLYENGRLLWNEHKGNLVKAGEAAGGMSNTGYRTIGISGKKYREHRLIFLYHHGYIPDQIDHINRNKSDNRIENLRPATHSTNQANTNKRESKSGLRGVRYLEKSEKWL